MSTGIYTRNMTEKIQNRLDSIDSPQKIEELYFLFNSIENGIVPLVHFNSFKGTPFFRVERN